MPAHPVIPPLDRASDRNAPGRWTIARPVDLTGKGAALAGSLLLNLGLLAGVVAAMRAPDFAPTGTRNVLVSVALRPEQRRSVPPPPPPERETDTASRKARAPSIVPEPVAHPEREPTLILGQSVMAAAKSPVPPVVSAPDVMRQSVSSPSSARPSEQEMAGELDRYRRMVWERILAARPRATKGSGTVTLGFTLDAAGNLVRSQVRQSSGQFLLDRMALQALRRAAPFPAPPQDVAGFPLAFTVPVEFH